MGCKYRLLISYDGRDFSGWQVQPNALSIQGHIEEALHTFLKTKIRLIGAGRTDAGVHALGQVAHFSYEGPLDCDKALYALNGLLPHSIRIKEIVPTYDTFHAQYSALSKIYHYHLWLEKVMEPFYRPYRHKINGAHFSMPLLEKAATLFVGTHDFTTFANVGSSVKHTVRTLHRVTCIAQEGGLRIEFEGDGFLYKMVRNIVGTLLEVATHQRALEEIPQLFAAKDRRKAGAAAPAHGLFLVHIEYPNHEFNAEKEDTCTKERPMSFKSALTS